MKLDAPKNITVSNNLLVVSGSSAGLRVALLMGGGTTDFNLINNTMVGTMAVRNLGSGPLDINQMYNNIIGNLSIDNDGACKPHVVAHGNNIFGENPDVSAGLTYPFVHNETELIDQTLTTGYFTNYFGNDFTLLSNSPAVNYGNATYAPTTDILGNQRDSRPDAGAYEFQGATPPATIYGDVNNDGAVSLSDSVLVIQATLGLTTLTSSQTQKGDVSGDGRITAYDAALILQKIAGIISKFPVE